tara:strand:- start:683 stop:910 length:228 start_codon:yes stop_codon:yes gene_type:complete
VRAAREYLRNRSLFYLHISSFQPCLALPYKLRKEAFMPNRKAKERKMERKSKNAAIKKYKRNIKKLKKEKKNEQN